ncbi:hypothetical protein JNUCC1_02163 [Lentibacillus sp. JNUCC-1]|nr:hypothetical protein [Lentibacillus sp. JNUCC-1]
MYQLVLLYLAAMLAGFALANVPASAAITQGIADFLAIVGSLAVVVFAAVLIYLGVKSLITRMSG